MIDQLLKTPLTELAGIKHPVVQTGMGWVAGPRLVSGTANAGGLGILASATMTLAELESAIVEVKNRTDQPFGVNLRADAGDAPDRCQLLIDHGVKVASFALAPKPELIAKLKEHDIVVIPSIGAPKHAKKVASWGADAVMIQGGEGGGHTGNVPTTLLLPTVLDAVTKDQLNTGLTGQIRYQVSERNLYAYLFGVKNPIAHVMGYFVSILRERIANFEAPTTEDGQALRGSQPTDATLVTGISINDLRKNLRDLNDHMDLECESSAARYGVTLDASLITEIDPPPEVESALAAINTAHNHVSSEISLAHAAADQKIVQSKRAVEIETLKAQGEVEPLERLAEQLADLKRNGPRALSAYLRNVRLGLYDQAHDVILEVER